MTSKNLDSASIAVAPRLPTWAWALGLLLLFSALSPGRVIAFDVAIRAAVAHALWAHQTVFVTAGLPLSSGLVHVPGRGATSFYGIGQSLFLIPFDFLGSGLARLPGLSDWARAQAQNIPIVWGYVPLVGLWWWWAVVQLLREWGLSKRHSLRVSTLFLLSTIALVYCAQTAQEEALVGALLTSAAVFTLRWCRDRRRTDACLTGALFGAAVLCRLNAALVFLPLLGHALDSIRQKGLKREEGINGILGAASGFIPAIAMLGLFAYWRFGTPFSTGYDLARDQGLGVNWTSPRPWLALALFIGPGKGMLILSPALFLSFVGLWKLAKPVRCDKRGLEVGSVQLRGTGGTVVPLGGLPLDVLGMSFRPGSGQQMRANHPAYVVGTVIGLAGACLTCSRIINNPDGSECWGVRYLVHWVGLLAYPAALTARAWLKAPRWRIIPGLVFAGGIAIQLMVFFAPDGVEYFQSDRAAHHRYELISGVSDGQLGLRVRNVVSWCLHRQLADPRIPELTAMEASYIPNVWGYSYARKLNGHPTFSGLILAAWIVELCTACCLLGMALIPGQSPYRIAGPQSRESSSLPAARAS